MDFNLNLCLYCIQVAAPAYVETEPSLKWRRRSVGQIAFVFCSTHSLHLLQDYSAQLHLLFDFVLLGGCVNQMSRHLCNKRVQRGFKLILTETSLIKTHLEIKVEKISPSAQRSRGDNLIKDSHCCLVALWFLAIIRFHDSWSDLI